MLFLLSQLCTAEYLGDTGAKETGGKETRVKAMGVRETGGKVSRGKVTEVQFCQETGGKGDRLIGERENDNILPGVKAAGQNVMEGIQWKSYQFQMLNFRRVNLTI